MINPNWSKWIYGSLTRHFDQNTSTQLYYQGVQRPPDMGNAYAEFRQTGPFYTALSADEYRARVVVNLLYKIGKAEGNFHQQFEVAGDLSAAFVDSIPVHNVVDPDDSDQDILIGCLNIDSGPRVLHYGQIEKDLAVEQGTVEATYLIYLQ